MSEIRAFIAAEIPEEIKEKLWALHNEFASIAPEIRWVRKEGMHLTFKFLGNVDEGKIDEFEKALQATTKNTGAIRLEIKSLGAFPKTTMARVLWVGVSGELEKLQDLANKIEATMNKFGFERENRDFVPHITLGRIKFPKRNRKLEEKIQALSEQKFGEFEIKGIVIFKSELHPQGAIYTELARIPLE